MKKLLVLILLIIYGSISACSASQSDTDLKPGETIFSPSSTIDIVQPTDTPEKEATATPTPLPEPSETPEPTPIPNLTLTEEPEYPANRVVTETLMLEYDPNETNWIPMAVSADGYRLAYKKNKGGDLYVVVEGNEYGPYEDLSSLYFSADSQNLAYIASLGDKQFVVLDGVEQTYYDEILTCGCSWAEDVELSPDGQRIAYVAKKNQKPLVVVDGEEFNYDGIDFPIVFSPDSQQVAFEAADLNAYRFVVVDGEEGKKYDGIDSIYDLKFSPDSNHLVYSAKSGDDWFVVVDGKEIGPWDESPFDITFSPDSQHIAYDAQRDGQMFIVLDGVELEAHDRALFPTFSPDSTRLAYKAIEDGWEVVIVDGIADPKYFYSIYGTTFSPDSQRLAYRVEEGENEFVVVDGKEGKRYKIINSVQFSPNSQHYAHDAFDGEKWYVILDGEEIGDYESKPTISFSPDSEHIVYIAGGILLDQFVVVDGVEGRTYDKIFDPGIVFDSPDSFHYMAVIGDEVYLVEESITEGSITEGSITNTPTITPIPPPDFSKVALTLDDLPPGFEEGSPAEFGLEPGQLFGNTKIENAFAFKGNEHVETIIVCASAFVPTIQEQNEFDSLMPNMIETILTEVKSASGAENDQTPEELSNLVSFGDASVGMTSTFSEKNIPLRMDIVIFRRGDIGVLIYTIYVDRKMPVVPIGDIANTLDIQIIGLTREILFFDDFSDSDSGWDRDRDQVGIADYENGIYRIFVNEANYISLGNPYKNFTDTRIEVSATKVGGPDDNYFGVICRYQDIDNYYELSISSDGFYGIFKYVDDKLEIIGQGRSQVNAYIKQGQATNKIRAECIGDKLTLYVNGKHLLEVRDDSFASGDVGLLAGIFDVPGVDIHFDNFIVFSP